MLKCATCGKEIEGEKLFEKGLFFCSEECRKKAEGRKQVCEGGVCKLA